jgi:hypothetical protein
LPGVDVLMQSLHYIIYKLSVPHDEQVKVFIFFVHILNSLKIYPLEWFLHFFQTILSPHFFEKLEKTPEDQSKLFKMCTKVMQVMLPSHAEGLLLALILSF